jgi:hypothetical protein
MHQLTIGQFETEAISAINRRLGLLYYECDWCQKEYDQYIPECDCGMSVILRSDVVFYRDCGCLLYYRSKPIFKIKTIKSCNMERKVRNFDLTQYLNKFHITKILYLKVGAQTHINFHPTNYQSIGWTDKDIPYINYFLRIPDDNNNMMLNGVPCKLFYTETTPSIYRGYFTTYIIALNYDIIYEHFRRCKLLRRIHHDKRSLFSKLPKELMFIIKLYLVSGTMLQ